ncbi:unnamed protein product [Symbiodinium sp. KB8]|nr:unnamed protein product [Symbiodinium sp. KB8]
MTRWKQTKVDERSEVASKFLDSLRSCTALALSKLQQLDKSMRISEAVLTDLLLDNSGSSRAKSALSQLRRPEEPDTADLVKDLGLDNAAGRRRRVSTAQKRFKTGLGRARHLRQLRVKRRKFRNRLLQSSVLSAGGGGLEDRTRLLKAEVKGGLTVGPCVRGGCGDPQVEEVLDKGGHRAVDKTPAMLSRGLTGPGGAPGPREKMKGLRGSSGRELAERLKVFNHNQLVWVQHLVGHKVEDSISCGTPSVSESEIESQSYEPEATANYISLGQAWLVWVYRNFEVPPVGGGRPTLMLPLEADSRQQAWRAVTLDKAYGCTEDGSEYVPALSGGQSQQHKIVTPDLRFWRFKYLTGAIYSTIAQRMKGISRGIGSPIRLDDDPPGQKKQGAGGRAGGPSSRDPRAMADDTAIETEAEVPENSALLLMEPMPATFGRRNNRTFGTHSPGSVEGDKTVEQWHKRRRNFTWKKQNEKRGKILMYHKCPEDVEKKMDKSREKAWAKWQEFSAAIILDDAQYEELIREGAEDGDVLRAAITDIFGCLDMKRWEATSASLGSRSG